MHDLNTINKLNAETLGVTAQHLRAQGRWVILHKDGLHFTRVESFSTHQEAMNAYLHQVGKIAVSESINLLAPTTTTPATGLDATVNPDHKA
jgi:response regulator RpfG family c-di-GMP phosphodiesterase